jgi:hypothetical protein
MVYSISFWGATYYFNNGRLTEICSRADKKCTYVPEPAEEVRASEPEVAEASFWDSAYGASRGGMLGCGGTTAPSPEVEDMKNGGISVLPGEAGSKEIPLGQFEFSGTGERFMEFPLEDLVFDRYLTGLRDLKKLSLKIYTDTTSLGEGFPCVDGLVDVTHSQAIALAKDPSQRLPLKVVHVTMLDVDAGEEYSLVDAPVPVGAQCADGSASGAAAEIPIDKSYFKDINYNNVNARWTVTLEVDASNCNSVLHTYKTNVAVFLVAE